MKREITIYQFRKDLDNRITEIMNKTKEYDTDKTIYCLKKELCDYVKNYTNEEKQP